MKLMATALIDAVFFGCVRQVQEIMYVASRNPDVVIE